MVTVAVSLLAGAGWQFLDNNGAVLNGGKLYVYEAGGSTPTTTYTSSAGSQANTNPIILNSAGRPSYSGSVCEVWVIPSGTYKLVMKTSADVQLWEQDNIPGFSAYAMLSSLGVSVQSVLDGFATRTAIKALTSYAGARAYLTEAGREGTFIYRLGNYASVAAADTAEGMYLVSTDRASSSGAWVREYTGNVMVDWFGALGDGSTNDATAFTAAVTYCASVTAILTGRPGATYSIGPITIPTGIGGLDFRDCVIKGRGGTDVTTITLGSSANPVTGADISVTMDMSAGDTEAIYGEKTSECNFTQCHIYGFLNNATYDHFGIHLYDSCNDNRFSDNLFELYDTPTQRGFGIAVYGNPGSSNPYGGFFNGAFEREQYPCVRNTITGNVAVNGSYGISIQGVEFSTVVGNVCKGQNHRAIYVAAGAYENTIAGNTCEDYTSSAILLGYGAGYNTVVGNTCYTSVAGTEAAINVIAGSPNNLIAANRVDSATNYGIYIATDSINCTVSGNDVRNHYLAGIAVDNDWVSPRPTYAIFARPNYGAPDVGSVWSFMDLTDTVIVGNTIRQGYTGRNTAAISLSQITTAAATGIRRTYIRDNTIASADNITQNLAFYADTDAELADNVVRGNRMNPGNGEYCYNASGSTTWNKYLLEHADNGLWGNAILESEVISFTDADTTPSVTTNNTKRRFRFANTGATSVTDFDDASEGQVITVRMDVNTTIVHNNSLIRLQGSANISGRSSNDFVSLVSISGIWYEITRSW